MLDEIDIQAEREANAMKRSFKMDKHTYTKKYYDNKPKRVNVKDTKIMEMIKRSWGI